MGKIFTWLIVAALVYLAIKVFIALQRKQRLAQEREAQKVRDQAAAGQATPARPAAAGAEVMVRCAQCGVYLPGKEAVVRGDRQFCSVAHRDVFPQQ